MSWWPRPPTPPTAVVDPSPMTATFTVSLGPTDPRPAPGIRRGIPSARLAAIEPVRKLRRGMDFILLLTMDLGWFGANGRFLDRGANG
jgi:hypothetical protein